jgi:CHASE1-domain containing sensor protein
MGMTPQSGREENRRWRRIALAAAALVLGLVLSVTAFFMVRNLETGKIQADFEQRARLMAESIKQSIDMSLDDAHSIVNLFSAAGEVDEGRFRLFVRPMLARHPTLLALLWVERVPDASREAYEAKLTARVRGFEISERGPDGQQVRAERRPEYFVVHYRESAAELDDSKVLGFDLGSGAAPREAIARSRDIHNRPVANKAEEGLRGLGAARRPPRVRQNLAEPAIAQSA